MSNQTHETLQKPLPGVDWTRFDRERIRIEAHLEAERKAPEYQWTSRIVSKGKHIEFTIRPK